MNNQQTNRSFIKPIITVAFARMMINVTRRFAYPFISPIAGQLQVPVSTIQNVIAIQGGIGILSPMFGTLSERFGRKWVMAGALIFMAIVSILGTIFPQFWIFALAMIAFGVGKMIYDPAMQAYVGDRVPYARRAQAIGVTELSWAGSMMIAAPLAGFLLEISTIQSIFLFFTVVLIVSAALVIIVLPSDAVTTENKPRFINPITAWNILRHSPAGIAALAFSFCLVTANELFFINYGLWMELSFELVLTALGTVTIVIAVAEVVGEFLVIGIADRIGKKRMTVFGAAGASVFYMLLPGLASDLPLALGALFMMFLCVEIAIVSSIPLFTEILPSSRAVMMSGNVAAHSIGRMAGATIGGIMYAASGDFQIIGFVAMIVSFLAAIILWLFVTE